MSLNSPEPSVFREARDGFSACLPILPAVAPFGALYAALATEQGFAVWQTLTASALIFAGASQYLMLDLLRQGLSVTAISLAVLAVNFRHVLYSAALGRRLSRFSIAQQSLAFFLMVDPTFAAAEQRARGSARLTPAWYFGYAVTVYLVWMLANTLGVVFGQLIDDPARYGFDFILPLYFLGVLLGFRGAPDFVPVLIVSAVVSVLVQWLIGPPWNILGGATAGLIMAALLSKPPADEAGHSRATQDQAERLPA